MTTNKTMQTYKLGIQKKHSSIEIFLQQKMQELENE